jgi:peptidyl-prolyl cis-trans isomerase D
MLQKMRDNAQGTVAKVIVVMIILTLTLFGFGAFTSFVSSDPTVAKVNGEEITQSVMVLEAERQRQRILAQLGENADPGMIDPVALQRSVVDGLITRTLLLQAAGDLGLAISDTDIDRYIVENPQFQTDGTFDSDLFRRVLGSNGLDPVAFREEFRRNVILVQLNGGVQDTAMAMDWETRAAAALLGQRRDVAYLGFAPDTFAAGLEITNEDVEARYQADLPDYMTEARVDVDYVELDVAMLANDASIEVSDADIEGRYEAEKTAFEPQERRRAQHILLEVNEERDAEAARAEVLALRDRIEAGESFEDLAEASSDDPGSAANGGDLGLVGRGVFVPEFEQAVYALTEGEMSDPVNTQFGVHLIRLVEIKADEFPSIDEMRADLAERLRLEQAEELFATRVRDLDQWAFEAPESLDLIVAEMGLVVQHSSDITRDEGEGVFAERALREAAFATEVLDQGFNSAVVELDGRAYVVRVATYYEPEQRPLESVAEDLRAQIANELAGDLARDAADEALERLEAGEGVTQVALTHGLDWQRVEGARRQMPDVDPRILQAAFGLDRPHDDDRAVGITQLADGSQAVVVVTGVTDGDYAALTENEQRAIRAQMDRRTGNLDLDGFFETARDESSISRRDS